VLVEQLIGVDGVHDETQLDVAGAELIAEEVGLAAELALEVGQVLVQLGELCVGCERGGKINDVARTAQPLRRPLVTPLTRERASIGACLSVAVRRTRRVVRGEIELVGYWMR
jgi:hypothetical protein